MSHLSPLTGKLLIAMPGIQDSIFQESVVFLCAHSDQGAMGLVINKPAPLMSFKDLLDEIELGAEIKDNVGEAMTMRVMLGGPVENFRGFILHDSDYPVDSNSLAIGTGYRLTTTVEILRDIARGRGPRRKIVTLGYAGWAPGQLENEIQNNGWLHCDASEELVFADDASTKHLLAMRTIGVNPAMLSNQVGHA